MSFFIKGLPNTRYISPHCIHDTCFSQAPLHPLYRIQFAFEISPFKSSSNMQITTAALVLFAAIGAVASPVESLSGDILIKFDGVSISSYLMFSWFKTRITANHLLRIIRNAPNPQTNANLLGMARRAYPSALLPSSLIIEYVYCTRSSSLRRKVALTVFSSSNAPRITTPAPTTMLTVWPVVPKQAAQNAGCLIALTLMCWWKGRDCIDFRACEVTMRMRK